MDILRRKPIPLIYANMPFVRESPVARFVDCQEDYELMTEMQAVARGEQCISSMEGASSIRLKCVFPDDILDRKGTSNDLLEWKEYYWRLYDVECMVSKRYPHEAVTFKEAGISQSYVDQIVNRTSCIPLLRHVEIMESDWKHGYRLEPKMIDAIQIIEAKLFAEYDLQCAKGTRKATRLMLSTPKRKSISAKLRNRVLSLDHYRCIFCGQGQDAGPLEVNHIIPVSLISRLNLDRALIDADWNLCTACFSCNRAKSDELTKEDIEYYLSRFLAPMHRNHQVSSYLKSIKDMQGYIGGIRL